MAKNPFRISVNQAFREVITSCAEVERKGPGNQGPSWITPEMIEAYAELSRQKHAVSIEVWDQSNLVGGIYGVRSEHYFSAESMFYKKPNASKVALFHLIDFLKSEKFTWVDIQVMTPHMKRYGAKNISQLAFLKRISFPFDSR